jgi:hypothetical protein
VKIRSRALRAATAAALSCGALACLVASPALAADPSTVTVGGWLVDDHGAPLGGIHLVIEELVPPDGGLAAFQVTTDAGGAFSADVEPWGTAAAPAKLTISTPSGDVQTIDVEDESCTHTYSVAVHDERDVALADGPIDPLTVSATTELVGEVCSTTATPPPTSGRTPTPHLTPPPTDAGTAVVAPSGERMGPVLLVASFVGLLAAAALVVSRPGARGRR